MLRPKIAVLVSGGGTNLQALLDAARAGTLSSGDIALVVSSRPGVCALERAEALGLLTSGERAMLEGERFLRAQVVYLSYFALSAPLKGGDGVLLDRTAASGGLSLRQLRDVMDGVTVERLG